MILASISTFVRADSGVVGVTISLVLGAVLLFRLLARELVSPMPRVVVRSLDAVIAVLFVLFALIVVERFHVLG